MKRREFLRNGAAALISQSTMTRVVRIESPPTIDSHVHLFDPTRPGGVPWPERADTILYQPALPDRLRQVSSPYGVAGAIAIEASPLISDNDWLLSVVERDPFMVAMIGNLEPGSDSFAADAHRFHSRDLFKGIRYGNLWNRDLATAVSRPKFLADLKLLSDMSLVFESANPDMSLLLAIQKIGESLPELTVVVDHLPHMEVKDDLASRRAFEGMLTAVGGNPRTFAKLSELVLSTSSSSLLKTRMHERLELLWHVFGPDRLLFGSDWPNGDHIASYGVTIKAARDFVSAKGPEVERKLFFENSRKVYGWKNRLFSQESDKI